ncbi:segregation and condensation protein A [Alkalispirochaeta alkalica]|uniref:segregation and condensation protein A n=1 Tax=Alkalispirochaeta alkalica TaxID=46356 RepID=UPI00037E78FB|nr:segregation/condensation protein A [Alkalispirochaeta alkalica]
MDQDESQTTTAPTVQLDQFEGPLDLLIFLIRKNEVNIYDIPISRITEQYLEYLKYAARVDLENATDFYVMAATLLYIKSRMLLPVPENSDDEEMDDPRQELVAKLIEYQRFRKLSDLMGDREEGLEYTLERRSSQTTLPFDEDEPLWEQLDVWDLLKTFSKLMNNLSADHLVSLHEVVTVNEKLTLIDELLERKGEFSFTDLVGKTHSVMDMVCAFIAILESARQRTIRILQNKMFGDIKIVAGTPVADSSPDAAGDRDEELFDI